MAIMHPLLLPDDVTSNRQLKGEVDTFEALALLSDEYEVFYNHTVSARQGSSIFERAIDFTIDFTVLHERRGMLAIEVKGGKIRIGPDGQFQQFKGRAKGWDRTDPFKQVKVATMELINACRDDGAKYWIPVDRCVIFPNTLRREITDIPQNLPNGVLCADDLALMRTQIATLFSKPRKGDRAWVREEFIDMRRRLQNLPEASRLHRLVEGVHGSGKGSSYSSARLGACPAIARGVSLRTGSCPCWPRRTHLLFPSGCSTISIRKTIPAYPKYSTGLTILSVPTNLRWKPRRTGLSFIN